MPPDPLSTELCIGDTEADRGSAGKKEPNEIPLLLSLQLQIDRATSIDLYLLLLLLLVINQRRLITLCSRNEDMAVVLDALAAHVMNMIKDMGKEEIGVLLSVSNDIKKLQDNVEPLQNLLVDAERRRITDNRVCTWVWKLKDAMYEAIDILDLCQLDAMERQEEHASSSGGGLWSLEGVILEKLLFVGCLADILQPFLFCVQNPGFANEVGSRIKKLNDELLTIHKGVADFNFNIDLGPYKEQRRTTSTSAHLMACKCAGFSCSISK